MFCSSRPYDRRQCNNNKCIICPSIVNINKFDCQVLGPIYKITCLLCLLFYVGESSRTACDRLQEHLRFASNPTSYSEECMAKHYSTMHPGLTPSLSFEILDTEMSTVKRKIIEAYYILILMLIDNV